MEQFLNTVGSKILGHSLDYEVFPSVAIAQAGLESGWNSSAETLYGIKATKGWKGKSKNIKTKENYDGMGNKNTREEFRAYESLDHSIKDYFKLLSTASWYKDVINAKTPRAAIKGLQTPPTEYPKLKYATDKNYETNVWRTLRSCNLTYYDKLKKQILKDRKYKR